MTDTPTDLTWKEVLVWVAVHGIAARHGSIAASASIEHIECVSMLQVTATCAQPWP